MKLPIPQRGQPIDVTFISDIVKSINTLYDQVAVKVSSYASLWTANGRKRVRFNEVKMITGQTTINLDKTTAADTFKDFEYAFDIAFASPPVVTATVINLESTASKASKHASVILTSVDTGVVRGTVKFEVAGDFKVAVNIIAVGLAV